VYKRGLSLVHIPTTWLAAIDSSHGGKTALNLAGAKNQIGTFYPATHTVLVRSMLINAPTSSADDAIGELAKIALIDGRAWAKKLVRPKMNYNNGKTASRAVVTWLWRQLPHAINAKLRVVKRDPFELRGHRQLLNLGHTLGHVLEAEGRISHGRSVALGLLFAVEFSEVTSALSSPKAQELKRWLEVLGVRRDLKRDRVSKSKARKLLRSDKKREAGNSVWFIVLRGFGKAERRKVDIEQILEVAELDGWLQ
jgi:3-dehydroquinate synthase